MDLPLQKGVLLGVVWGALALFAVARKIHSDGIFNLMLGAALLCAYFYWRGAYTIMPYVHDEDAIPAWMWAYLAIEFFSIADLLQNSIFKFEAGRREAVPLKPGAVQHETPSVNVLIPTYNEPAALLRRTLIRAKEIDYPNYTLHLLDDGNRPEIRALAQEMGVQYHTREGNKGAKAGNMNAALADLKGDFLAILDADFMAYEDFLSKAMPVFADDQVGCVQFPQTFYNPDPTQIGSGLYAAMHDEQWLWYHDILPSRDKANLATSCGSCSVVRRSALKMIGDRFPEETITEDFDMSLRLMKLGIRTRYMDAPVAIGLSPYDVNNFVDQRIRWSFGNMKAWRLAMFRPGKLRLMSYFLLFEWRLVSLPCRMVTLLIPTLVILAGLWPLKTASLGEYLAFTIPFMLTVGLYDYTSNRLALVLFYLNMARNAGVAIILGNKILGEVLLPKMSRKFGVTQKTRVDKPKMGRAQIVLLISVCAGTIALCLGLYYVFVRGSNIPMYEVSVIWQTWNLVLLIYAARIFSNKPTPRSSDRFIPREPMEFLMRSTEGVAQGTIRLLDISEGGMRLIADRPVEAKQLHFRTVEINAELEIMRSRPVANDSYELSCRFTRTSQDDIIRYVYSNRFIPEILGDEASEQPI